MRPSAGARVAGVVHDLTNEEVTGGAAGGPSKARWEAVVESAVDAIVVIDVHGAIESLNPAAELLFGYQESDVLGRNVTLLMPSPYREEHDGYLSRYLATGRAKVIGVGREVMGPLQDGTVFPLHLSVGEAQVGGQRKFTGILHDLRERVRIEGALRGAEVLARLGEMAAVIAHEVKNPLAAIRGAVQIIGSRLPEENSDRRVITEVVARMDALDRLMKELLLFARPPVVRSAPTDLADLVVGTAGLLRRDPGIRDVEVGDHRQLPGDIGRRPAPQPGLPEPAGERRACDAGEGTRRGRIGSRWKHVPRHREGPWPGDAA